MSDYFPTASGHLIYLNLEGPWFYINGDKSLGFKTRGDNEQDLFNALQKFNIDYWESDFEQCVKEMGEQLYQQMLDKQLFEVYLKRRKDVA